MSDDTAIVVRETNEISLGTLKANTPAGLLDAAAAVATPLAAMIRKQGLASMVQGKSYVRCEGWTTMGAMLGIIPREVSNADKGEGVYEAIVELVNMRTGEIVGRASAECGNPDEVDRKGVPVWAGRPAYARRSMAATRATSKAFRLSFSWIMTLAGFEATPAEEMDGVRRSGWERDADSPGGHSADADGRPVFRGKITNRTVKEGKRKDGSPWALYIFRGHDGSEYATFSNTVDEGLGSLLGNMVEIVWEPTDKGGKNIVEYRSLA